MTLNINVKVDSLEKGKELLNKLEVLEKYFEVNVELSINTTSRLFQVIPEEFCERI
ncbi:Uncharacterised protein [Lysinibacillus capsici]|uniref:Uncharacterized protein n=2 Tax=Lysinibacillus capsici TaxID=2115968 RepID=A0A2X0XJ55_9BACI|nr:Uncharacterised protein [Lysinibacillus capsici]